jgi:two-component system sensor histidine kinase/response regulator
MLLPESLVISPPGRVLIVDDLPVNASILAAMLKLDGFEISVATGGEQALQMIETLAPDVVLLDVMMPGMDGFETCLRIRANPLTHYLPVVMVTALQGTKERMRALEVGADDFIAKPVDQIEVVARVSSLVRAKRGRDELELAYTDLRRSEGLRDSLTQMLVHDLRTPLTGLMVSLEVLAGEQVGNLNDTQKGILEISKRSGTNLLNLVNDILSVAKLESGQLKVNLVPISFPALVEEALVELTPLINERHATIEREWAPDLPSLTADRDLIHRLMVNLLSNALKFSPHKPTISIGALVVAAEDANGGDANGGDANGGDANGGDTNPEKGKLLRVWVRDNGYGISPEHHKSIWDKFGQAETRPENFRASTGLGLTFCKLATEAHGGTIGVESELGQGSTFHFTLPVRESPKPV